MSHRLPNPERCERGRRFWPWVLGAVSALLVSGVAAAAEPSARPVVLQLHWYAQAQFAGYLIAKEKGYFREAGLPEVEIRWSRAGERPLEQLTSGQADFCTAWLSTAMVARAHGAPLVHLAQVLKRSSMLLVARRTSGIRTPQDMNGRRVGLWGGDFDVLPTAFFKKFNLQPEIVPQSTSVVPFLRGGVAVASAMEYNEYHKLLESGLREEELEVFRLADYGFDFPEDGLYTTEATRRDRPEMCAALVAAVQRGWSYALAHEPETLDVVMAACQKANRRTNRPQQQWMLRAIGRALTTPEPNAGSPSPALWGHLARETYEGVAQVLHEQGLLDEPPAWNEFCQPPGAVATHAISPAH